MEIHVNLVTAEFRNSAVTRLTWISITSTNYSTVDEAVTAECLQMLLKILNVREKRLGSVHTATAESYRIHYLLVLYHNL
jgi:hypothetical protein